MTLIEAAPLQGFTEAPFRHFHAAVYGNVIDCYYTPFIRVEHGEPRNRDMRDAMSSLNANHRVVPQIIFRDSSEFGMLIDRLQNDGFDRVDMNMGCPFPPQVKKGRGAGFLDRPAEMEQIARMIDSNPGIAFSVKMRLGVNDPFQWKETVRALNSMRLDHVTVHPRVAAQQYTGERHFESFRELTDSLAHPVIFNGDIVTPSDIDRIITEFPDIMGVMIGRGLLARPSLVNEWREGREWSRDERLHALRQLHDGIFSYYSSTLQGESQLLSKIKPFWEYLKDEAGKKTAKAIAKSRSVTAYLAAVNSL